MVSSSIRVHLDLPYPLPARHLTLPASTPLASLLASTSSSPLLYVRTRSSIPSADATLGSLTASGATDLDLQVACRILGGKGGFGAMLRATGGRMSSQKASNNDSCRDLSGRRLSTIKEAKKMADLLDAAESHAKEKSEATKARLATLERQLGISAAAAKDTLASAEAGPSGSGLTSNSDGSDAEAKEASPPLRSAPASTLTKLTKEDLVALAGKKHKFDDSEYLEQSREINDNVRSAVSAGLLKKRKKAKMAAATGAAMSSTTPTAEAAKASAA